jgi:hypothetical protein
MLFGRPAGNELAGKELPERWVFLVPAQFGQATHHFGFFPLLRRIAANESPACVTAVKNHVVTLSG